MQLLAGSDLFAIVCGAVMWTCATERVSVDYVQWSGLVDEVRARLVDLM